MDIENVDAVRILNMETERNAITLRQNNLDYLPKVTLSYSLSRNVSGPDFEFDSYSTNHGVSLNLSYSLWNQFRHSETAKRAKLSRQISMLSLAEKRDDISREYDAAREELDYLRELQSLYEEKLAQATEQIRIAEERYRLGMIQQLELDKTRSEFLDANIAASSNRYQIIAKQEALHFLLSQPILGKW
ncbi:MAG: TolC family protein, partial [Candidatus Cloacimonadaceae bacterium]|nr:TolC family protein [Candidatus Cloacimonadaceae bacterium]